MTPRKAPTDYSSISKPATCLPHRSSSAILLLILFWEKLSGSPKNTVKARSKPMPSSFPFNTSSGQKKKEEKNHSLK